MTNLTMGHAAFHPYHKIGVGFDRMFQELDRLMQVGTNTANGGYPPFNLEKTGKHSIALLWQLLASRKTRLNFYKKKIF